MDKRKVYAYWDNKIDGSGSPKFDRLETINPDSIDIPKDWLKIIMKPDGTKKKVILYNTGLAALLHFNEKLIDKIARVFNEYKEQSDQIALLWRPHPLTESTIRAMRPQLWDSYKKLRDRYIEEQWGIYDDSSDLDRAIIISDAYYGDGSSLVKLFQKTGKPVTIQDIEE